MQQLPTYSVAIRTLGKAGEKYLTTLKTCATQTHKPEKIVVYLAEGFDKPKETIGIEQIVYVKKGMIAQRALSYDEISSEYILCLDDDVELSPDSVERLFAGLWSMPATASRTPCRAINTSRSSKKPCKPSAESIHTGTKIGE